MKQSIGSIFLTLTLLFSMTEISKVAIVGYSLFTDGEKVAHFCTCIGCSHDTNSGTEHCAIDMEMDKSHDSSHSAEKHGSEEKPAHCDMTQTASGESVCGCQKGAPGQMHILFNTLDKTALLAESGNAKLIFDKRFFKQLHQSNLSFFQKDIFHPPQS
ncbi:hypothetical protein [Rhodohalobacter halophilus]|uniref:hypothetical protein n=1 Tax=Rhodohalobacter halophilus TaxID=1812810 RepID=UPI00083FB268|nr:hypothetical protein [Rhodohalobacter halophilus]